MPRSAALGGRPHQCRCVCRAEPELASCCLRHCHRAWTLLNAPTNAPLLSTLRLPLTCFPCAFFAVLFPLSAFVFVSFVCSCLKGLSLYVCVLLHVFSLSLYRLSSPPSTCLVRLSFSL